MGNDIYAMSKGNDIYAANEPSDSSSAYTMQSDSRGVNTHYGSALEEDKRKLSNNVMQSSTVEDFSREYRLKEDDKSSKVSFGYDLQMDANKVAEDIEKKTQKDNSIQTLSFTGTELELETSNNHLEDIMRQYGDSSEEDLEAFENNIKKRM